MIFTPCRRRSGAPPRHQSRDRGHEIEDVILRLAEPVLPAFVPALDQYGIEPVLGGEVDVLLHVFGRRSVTSVRTELRVVRDAQLHGRHVIRVGPGRTARNHLPPYADVLAGMDPRRILDLAGLVQVERHARSEDVAGVVRHDDRAPGCVAGRLHVALVAPGIGGSATIRKRSSCHRAAGACRDSPPAPPRAG